MSGVRYDDAKVHLRLFDADHEVDCRVAVGPAPLVELLSPARALTYRVADLAIEQARRDGKEPSCQTGCAACCRQLVPVSPIEAVHLGAVVAAMPPERQRTVRARFDAALLRMEELGIVERGVPRGRHALVGVGATGKEAWEDASGRYFRAAIPCPFLEDERCTVYPDRPLVCAEYVVTTPAERCADLGGAEAVARPLRMNEMLADAGHAVAGAMGTVMPLPLALEWAETHGATLAGAHDGEASFWALIDAITREQAADGDDA